MQSLSPGGYERKTPLKHHVYMVPGGQGLGTGLDTQLLSSCTPTAPIPPAVPCLALSTSDRWVSRSKAAVGSSHQPPRHDSVQDPSVPREALSHRFGWGAHTLLQPVPPNQGSAGNTCDAAAAPACLRGKAVWGCLRAGCPGHSGRTLPLVPRTLSVPRPVPRCLRSCPTHALVSTNPTGG